MMLRSLALCALVALTASACDSGGDVQPLGGLLYVSLEGTDLLKLEASFDLPCGPRIATTQENVNGRFQVTVLGVEATTGACPDVRPSTKTITLDGRGATSLPIDLFYGGVPDEYRYSVGPRGARLDSVRTTVSRLGPRPR